MNTERPNDPINFIQRLKRLTLSSSAHERMRAALSAYADVHTVPTHVPQPASSFLSGFMLRTRSLYAGALALVVLVAGGTQASLAAEDALPGDILYPIKVALSEPLSLALTPSGEQKAELSAKFATRRLDEATLLATSGKLDEKTADELAGRFDTHVDVLTKETEALEAEGANAVSLAVRTDLEQKVTEQLQVSASEDSVGNQDILMAVAADPKETFAVRVFEKSQVFTRAKDRIALEAETANTHPIDLAVLRAQEPEGVTVVTLNLHTNVGTTLSREPATTTATSTATTTLEVQAAPVEPTPASRFFSPFFKKTR